MQAAAKADWRALTDCQRGLLAYLLDFQCREGRPPSRGEIARHLGWHKDGRVDPHLAALQHKGYLTVAPGQPYGIRLSGVTFRPAFGKSPVGRLLKALHLGDAG